MSSVSLPWTKIFFAGSCPCGSHNRAYNCCWKGGGRWRRAPIGVIPVRESSYRNMHCYLSELGNCSDKVTREHFISKNILEKIAAAQGEPNTKTHSLEVQNACDFFGGKPVTQIGINAFSAKVLCDNHNPALSAIDTAAGLAFETIERLTEDLIALDNGNELKSLYIASGLDIERWMVKVFCGLSAAGKIRGRSGNSLKKGAPQTTFL